MKINLCGQFESSCQHVNATINNETGYAVGVRFQLQDIYFLHFLMYFQILFHQSVSVQL